MPHFAASANNRMLEVGWLQSVAPNDEDDGTAALLRSIITEIDSP